MKKLFGFFVLAIVALCAPHGTRAACSGASPTWTAASALQSEVALCFAEPLVCGDKIVIPAGTATWSSTSTVFQPPTGCAANTGITLQGATTCSSGCAAGSGGTGLAFTGDTTTTCGAGSTCITISVDQGFQMGQNFAGISNTAFARVTGITFLMNVAAGHCAVCVTGTTGQVSFRFDHLHFINSTITGGVQFDSSQSYGLLDHILWDQTVGSGEMTPVNVGGDFPSSGYADWAATTNFGTNQYVIVEDSWNNQTNLSNSEGFYDGYFGCKITIRHSIITNNQIGGGHGTDSGGYRGCVNAEFYNLTVTNNSGPSSALFNTRSGAYLLHDNTIGGTFSTPYSGVPLQLYRLDTPGPVESTTWGTAQQGVNWTPIKVSTGSTCGSTDCVAFVTANAPDWQSAHTYTCSPSAPCIVGPLLHNTGAGGIAGGFNFVATVSGISSVTEPNPWNQTVAGTQSDGTMTWTNIGGGTAASPNPGSADGFQTANPDTACSSGSCARYLDANGGVYPFRDQPGTIHNQVIYGNYQWNNTATGNCSSACYTMSGDGTAVQSGRDFFNGSTPGGYTTYTYPDPLQGGTSTTSSSTGGGAKYGGGAIVSN